MSRALTDPQLAFSPLTDEEVRRREDRHAWQAANNLHTYDNHRGVASPLERAIDEARLCIDYFSASYHRIVGAQRGQA